MAQFFYKARKRSGELVQGMLEVADRSSALLQIERMGLFPIMVDGGRAAAAAMPKGGERSASGSNLMPAALRGLWRRKRRPKLRELATFTQQMANLLQSGMPLTVALNSMTHLESKGIPSEVSKQLKQDVMEGKALSDSMSRQGHVFGDMYINMVRAGEQSGALVEVLRRLADHYVRFSEVQSKFKSAMVYPAFVASVGIGIIIFFMSYMLPKFMSIFDGMNVALPMSTLFLKNSSEWFAQYWWAVIAVIIAGVVLFVRFKGTPAGRRKVDHWKMNLPVFGKVVRLNLFGQFSRTLSTLLQNGVPVLTALKITEEIVPNVIIKEAIAQTREEVTDGKTIAQPLARSKIFPQLMIDLLKIGEETGDVPGALRNLADTYEGELAVALRMLTDLIEPVLIITLAVGVGFLLFSVLSAMFAITSTIGQ
ncbi:MAG TPA: type II secretion system protein [Verrucomicrobiales bacterium]|nr:type II secretion system protein [Verrucomicrobiales bacterium]